MGAPPAGLLDALVQLVTVPVTGRVVTARALRGFADGLVSVLLAGHLTRLGFSPTQVGAIVTGTLLGSATLTIGLGLVAHRLALDRVLVAASLIMVATGVGFAGLSAFWPLLAVAVVGTLNPSAGDVSVFVPVEQALLAGEGGAAGASTRRFAWYNVAGNFAGALGALAAALPPLAVAAYGMRAGVADRAAFGTYAGVGLLLLGLYLRLGPIHAPAPTPARAPLARSRRLVGHLSVLFALDAFGGGFAVQALLVLWLHQRFGLSPESMASIFFGAGLASALSQFVSPWLAGRIGHIRTMVYTHLPANAFLVAAGLAPTAPLAVGLLLCRAALSQMDVPARQAYVMAVVPADERAAAASVTNVPRSLASAIPPLFTGWMLTHSDVGWPLVAGGLLKITYDLLLLRSFRALPAPPAR